MSYNLGSSHMNVIYNYITCLYFLFWRHSTVRTRARIELLSIILDRSVYDYISVNQMGSKVLLCCVEFSGEPLPHIL